MAGSPEMLAAFRELTNSKQLDRSDLLDLLKDGIHAALVRKFGPNVKFELTVDELQGTIRVSRLRTVVETVDDLSCQVALEEAQFEDPDFQLGDVLEEEVPFTDFGRLAVQAAKQRIIQRVREGERTKIREEFGDKVGELLSGEVQQIERGKLVLMLAKFKEAEAIVAGIEQAFRRQGHQLATGPFPKIRLRSRTHTRLSEVAVTLFRTQRQRTVVGLSLMAAQAFFYNAIFFTYALVLIEFYGIRADHVGWYILPFAAGNFLGPVLIGRLFDTWGRRPMLTLTYAMSGLLLAVTGYLFAADLLTAETLTIAWMIIFFFASSAASAAYLTVSETFPLEIRALAIAFFYAVGTGIGGVAGPLLFGALIETGSRTSVFLGYLLGAALMIGAAVVAAFWSVAAERRPLEEVSRPLASED